MDVPKIGSALGSADLGMTTPANVNTKETTCQRAEKVSVLNILNMKYIKSLLKCKYSVF